MSNAEQPQRLEVKARRTVFRWALGFFVVLMSCGALLLSNSAQKHAARAATQGAINDARTALIQQQIAGSCGFYRLIATAPLGRGKEAPKELGLRFVAASRHSYIQLGCSAEQALPPADPRLYPYLPVGER